MCHRLFQHLVRHVQRAAAACQAQVVIAQHTQLQADLGTDGIQLRIEGFLSDGELGQAHRQDAVPAPCQEGQRRFGRDDFDDASAQQGFVGDHPC